jgi:hypothetical protein
MEATARDISRPIKVGRQVRRDALPTYYVTGRNPAEKPRSALSGGEGGAHAGSVGG